jgi:hypothetical protein
VEVQYYLLVAGWAARSFVSGQYSMERTPSAKTLTANSESESGQAMALLPRSWTPHDSALDWYPDQHTAHHHTFTHINNSSVEFTAFYNNLTDGSGIAVRTRSFKSAHSVHDDREDQNWEYGVCVKKADADVFCQWEHGRLQSHAVDEFAARVQSGIIELAMIIEYRLHYNTAMSANACRTRGCNAENFVILSHGFSPEAGSSYRFLKSMEAAICG